MSDLGDTDKTDISSKENSPITNLVLNFYANFMNLEKTFRDSILSFSISIALIILFNLLSKFVHAFLLLFIILDFLFFGIIYIYKIKIILNKYFSLGINDMFSNGSLFYRAGRFFIYSIIVQILFFNTIISFRSDY